jgi:D-3-phosphoglycerate dehydrogenase
LKVLVTAPFSEEGLERLRDAGLEVVYESWLDTGKLCLGPALLPVTQKGGYDIVIVEGDEIKEEVLEKTKLKIVASVRGSPNNIAVEAATAKGIPVLAAPGRNTTAVAELTICLILAQARNIIKAERILKADFMVDDFGDFASMYSSLVGFELKGRIAGIIGLGQIGTEVAKRLRAFGMQLLIYDPYAALDRIEDIGGRAVDLATLLRESDVVTIHCAPTEETARMIGAKEIQMMKKSSILINTARASITDEQALLEALKSGQIAGAGLDVFSMEPVDCDNIFLGLDNVTVMPHMGGNTVETIRRQSEMVCSDILAILDGRRPVNILNPEVLEKGGLA